MNLDDLLKVLLAGGSLTAGASLTAVRAKLATTRTKTWLHWIFYVVCGLIILADLLTVIFCWHDFVTPTVNWFAFIVSFIALICCISLVVITKMLIVGKHQFATIELDPVVNKFTSNADKTNIKLLAGNLDFWGSGQQMDQNSQYVCLRQEGFREIQILCIRPSNTHDKIRYGKILSDFPQAAMRYYQPSEADLHVRGRIKTLNLVTRLLIYNRVSPGIYEALELDTADHNGAHYSLLWNLIWTTAEKQTPEEISEYIDLYRL